jgi:chromosome segregation ATPase
LSDAHPRRAGVNAAKEDTEQVSKQIKLLDNQLEKALVRLNEAVNRNKLLREDIDHLRKERLVFDTARAATLLHIAQPLTVHARFARRSSASCTRRGATWRTWWTSPTM